MDRQHPLIGLGVATHPFRPKTMYHEQHYSTLTTFPSATHTFPQNLLYRERETVILLLFSAATHHFLGKNLYRYK